MFRPLNRRGNAVGLPSLTRVLAPSALTLAIVAFLVLTPVPLDALVLIAPLGAAVMLLNPVTIPLALIASVPVQDAIPIPEAIPITATRLATGAAVALFPFVLVRRWNPLRWSGFLNVLGALIAVMTVSLWNAQFLTPGYEELYRWLVAGVTFWLVLQLVETRRHLILALVLVGALAFLEGGLGIGQSLTGAGPASFQIGGGISRAFGTFGMPNSFAAYMEMVSIPLVPVSIWAADQVWRRARGYRLERFKGYLASANSRRNLLVSLAMFLVIGGGAFVGLAAIALSFSRGGWLGTASALGVVVLLLGRRAIFTSCVLVATLSLLLFISAPGAVLVEIQQRFNQLSEQAQIGDVSSVPVTDENFATVERLSHWQTAVAMWDEHPWLGVGAGNYNERFTEFAVHPQFDESQGHAHNYYLHLLAETGAAGLLAYLALLFATFAIGWRAYRSRDALTKAIGIGAIGLSTALTVHNFFENLHVLNISLQMMLIWALALIATKLASSSDPGVDDPNSADAMLYDSGRAMDAQRGISTRVSLREQH